MNKNLLTYFVAILYLCFSQDLTAQSSLQLFDAQLSYRKLDSKVWKKYEQHREKDKGMIAFMHNGIKDSTGILVKPVISIVYERIEPKTLSVVQFAEMCRKRSQFTIYEQIDREDLNAVIYFYGYDNGMVHNLIVAYFVCNGNGIQVVADSTESVYSKVEYEIQRFIESVKIEALHRKEI